MGRLADEMRDRLRDRLAERLPDLERTVERDVGGTPVDVAGSTADRLVAVELEWRRADPADNTAKLFWHLAEGSVEATQVDVFQVFAAYYDLGGCVLEASQRRVRRLIGSGLARSFRVPRDRPRPRAASRRLRGRLRGRHRRSGRPNRGIGTAVDGYPVR